MSDNVIVFGLYGSIVNPPPDAPNRAQTLTGSMTVDVTTGAIITLGYDAIGSGTFTPDTTSFVIAEKTGYSEACPNSLPSRRVRSIQG
ncbi:hypothetical protein [Granulicella sibirica]|uniref:Uncharacterized protein n=1 Tax=Granulicella sibirica TaxID=2479048 RepID=A0A4Q0T5E3_9BACT|nr:hypothetical protein [Granulicella sibirica]RXH58943.1 hypothetical protein GRAN_2253 [Granulicella sibirica]